MFGAHIENSQRPIAATHRFHNENDNDSNSNNNNNLM